MINVRKVIIKTRINVNNVYQDANHVNLRKNVINVKMDISLMIKNSVSSVFLNVNLANQKENVMNVRKIIF